MGNWGIVEMSTPMPGHFSWGAMLGGELGWKVLVGGLIPLFGDGALDGVPRILRPWELFLVFHDWEYEAEARCYTRVRFEVGLLGNCGFPCAPQIVELQKRVQLVTRSRVPKIAHSEDSHEGLFSILSFERLSTLNCGSSHCARLTNHLEYPMKLRSRLWVPRSLVIHLFRPQDSSYSTTRHFLADEVSEMGGDANKAAPSP